MKYRFLWVNIAIEMKPRELTSILADREVIFWALNIFNAFKYSKRIRSRDSL